VLTDPEHWEDPLKFSPKRFTPEKKKNRPNFLYIPFSAGQRQCLGTKFALTEQKLLVARIVQKYQIVDPVEHKPFITCGDNMIQIGRSLPVHVRFVKR